MAQCRGGPAGLGGVHRTRQLYLALALSQQGRARQSCADWNYVAIHARGPIHFFHDAAELHEVVSRLTRRHEAGRAQSLAVTDAPVPFVQSQLRAIVGFSLRIDALEGKWKMSQNRNEADRAGVRAGLAGSDNPG